MPSKNTSSNSNTNGGQRTVGLQTVQNDRTYISPGILAYHKLEVDEFHWTFYKPHTIISLGLLLIILYTLATIDLVTLLDNKLNPQQVALIGTAIAFIGFAMIHFPNTLLRRPHPLFWRALMGTFTLYSFFMTYVFMHPVKEAREVFKIFDSSLGVPLEERTYGADCRVFTPENPHSQYANISDAVFDVHFVAHFLGWWGKMLIMRDVYVAWICSIGFEIIEITFKHWLENFQECWWDHLFLDLFGCNLIGIVLGAISLKYLAVSKIHWVHQPDNIKNKDCSHFVKSAVEKFKPQVLEQYNWGCLSSLENYLGVALLCAMILVVDSNNFFMKYVLHVPAEHDLLKFRVAMWGFVAIATSKEWYEFVTNPLCRRLGPFSWLAFYTIGIEVLITVKFQEDSFQTPFPEYVKIIWAVIGVAFTAGAIVSYRNGLNQPKMNFNPYNPEVEVEGNSKKSR